MYMLCVVDSDAKVMNLSQTQYLSLKNLPSVDKNALR